MHLDARKVVLSLVMFSNIGGAATGIGDPPNVLIINSPYFKNVREKQKFVNNVLVVSIVNLI